MSGIDVYNPGWWRLRLSPLSEYVPYWYDRWLRRLHPVHWPWERDIWYGICVFVVDRLLYTPDSSVYDFTCVVLFMNNFLKQVCTNTVGQYPWYVSFQLVDGDILCLLWMPKCLLPVPKDFLDPRGREATLFNIRVLETFFSGTRLSLESFE
jgi:hypothetical protein